MQASFIQALPAICSVFERMKELYPNRDLYTVSYGSGISVRSVKPEYNISQFLAQFGSDGHPGAVGISIPFEKRLGLVAKAFNGEIFLDERKVTGTSSITQQGLRYHAGRRKRPMVHPDAECYKQRRINL